MKDIKMEKLAIAGGKPVSAEQLKPMAWPPRDKATAKRLNEVYMSGKWSFNGPEEQAFTKEFAAYHGAKYGVFMFNGTVTLRCALASCGVGPGDEVIVPALTFLATSTAVNQIGAKTVFADIDPLTLCMDPQKFKEAITSKTKAVIPVHLYGSNADLDAIISIARKRGIFVIEDCAHAQGGKWKGRGLGSWGDVGSFSFQQSKTLSCGEGGICLTNDEKLAGFLYRLKHIGYAANTAQGKAASGPPAGLICNNFRATEFQAVVLRGQLKKLDKLIGLYNRNALRLEKQLAGVPGLRIQTRGRLSGPQSYYGWAMAFEDEVFAGVPFNRIQEAAKAEGLPVGGTYGPVYKHMLWNLPKSTYRIANGKCPVAEGLASTKTAVLAHQWLGSDIATIDSIARIFAKIAANADALRKMK
ncbi:MAG TPA: DegT/DnrJ/EryC1/StrS family aminotransferase [Lentisphaeria bacterium]|nr:MAG: hypothetical protein A2X48_13710 [Lentisphaerae bacterium GWF2_49_21]HBC89714.1 DegT/DnrJ/EryC1/StrS family aminotransferase [Lentisphaeria bacterium]